MDKEELINLIEGRLICRPRNQCERDRNAVLTELAVDIKQSLSGYVIVPEEPTADMLAAVTNLRMSLLHKDLSAMDRLIMDYKAMLAAREG